jgi:hypothetical protein
MKHIKTVSVEKAQLIPVDLIGLLQLLTNPVGWLIGVIKTLFGLQPE